MKRLILIFLLLLISNQAYSYTVLPTAEACRQYCADNDYLSTYWNCTVSTPGCVCSSRESPGVVGVHCGTQPEECEEPNIEVNGECLPPDEACEAEGGAWSEQFQNCFDNPDIRDKAENCANSGGSANVSNGQVSCNCSASGGTENNGICVNPDDEDGPCPGGYGDLDEFTEGRQCACNDGFSPVMTPGLGASCDRPTPDCPNGQEQVNVDGELFNKCKDDGLPEELPPDADDEEQEDEEPNCPNGTWNPVTGKCEIKDDPTCTNGEYNPVTGKCEIEDDPNCTNGEYNPLTGKCEIKDDPQCTNGTWDPIQNRCVSDDTPDCGPGATWNERTKKCEANNEPDCGPGASWNDITKKCEADSPPECPSGFKYDENKKKCVYDGPPICPPGYKWNETKQTCEYDKNSKDCPAGQSYNPETKKCEKSSNNNTNDPGKDDPQDKETGSMGDAYCKRPPTCSGDAIQCEILKQQWYLHCYLYKEGKTMDDIFKGAGGDSNIAGTTDSIDEDKGDFSNIIDNADKFNLGGTSCPSPVTVPVYGTNVELSYEPFCTLAAIFAPFVLISAGLLSIKIINEGI